MKLLLSVILLSAILPLFCVSAAQVAEVPDDYVQVEVSDPANLADCTISEENDSYAFLLEADIEVPSDIHMDGGNLFFTSQDELLPVSLAFTGSDTSALSNQYSLMFDILSGLSFSDYHAGTILASGNLVIRNVNDGVDIPEQADVIFTDNSCEASSGGAAIYADGDVTISRNGGVIFSRNAGVSSTRYEGGGGAIFANGDVIIGGNERVTFTDNSITSYGNGGAIYAGGAVTISGNGDVSLLRNTLGIQSFGGYGGGAIYAQASVTISGNADLMFSENNAIGSGAVIYAPDVTISGNKEVSFTGNYVHNGWHGGGAIAGGTISICENELVDFSGNSALIGGAIYSIEYLSEPITISGNGDVIFRENTTTSSHGGAIFARGDVSICGNGNVLFSGNSSAYNGGAIRVYGNLCIQNNESVLFEKNAESSNGLRSIYAGGSGEVVSFSAAAGRSIAFHDSVYIAAGSVFNLNPDYIDAGNVTIRQQGDIIFTGATADADWQELKGRAASSAENQASRTSEVYTVTNLYGGRLLVEDGAIYKGYGVTAYAGSDSTVSVRDAVLDHADYELLFLADTRLETVGESEILGEVVIESTATAAFSALTRLEGSLTLVSGSSLLLDGELTVDGALYLGTRLTLGGSVLEAVNLLQPGESLTLVGGLESLAVQSSEDGYASVASGRRLIASDYFCNLNPDPNLVLAYNGAAGALSMKRIIPEPATTSLSLLALTALAARRRRR